MIISKTFVQYFEWLLVCDGAAKKEEGEQLGEAA